MSLLHLENDGTPFNALIAVSTSKKQFDYSVFELIGVYMIPVYVHNVLVGLHLAQSTHQQVEGVLGIHVDFRYFINISQIIFLQQWDQVIQFCLVYCVFSHFANDFLLCHILNWFFFLLFFCFLFRLPLIFRAI